MFDLAQITLRFASILLLLVASLFSASAAALDLFGLDLAAARRDQMRAEVKKTGAKLVSEAGKDAFYDIYEGDSLLHNAQRLYLGFVKKDQRFAFIEYEFNGLRQPTMLARLTTRYGKPQSQPGRYLTDTRYQWRVDGVQISLYQDWPAYKTRLSYIQPQALQQLRAEQQTYARNQRKQRLVYNEKAY